MSRIGKAPITVPSEVTVKVEDNMVSVKGPKGELSEHIAPEMEIKIEDIQSFERVSLINALLDLDQMSLPIDCIAI